jgi:hypothetical protein
VVRRVRQIHPRSNAIAVDVASGPLASAAE